MFFHIFSTVPFFFLRWAQTEQYRSVKRQLLGGRPAGSCPHCGEPVEADWSYCKGCGGKL